MNTTEHVKRELEGLVDSLLVLVEGELYVYGKMKDILAREFQSLAGSSPLSVNEINAEKEACLLRAKSIEKNRSVIVEKIALLCGIREKDVNFTFLIANTDSGRASHLKSLREKLLLLVGEINLANRKNGELLDFSLSCVRGSIGFLNGMLSQGGGYGSTGQLKAARLNGRVVNSRG